MEDNKCLEKITFWKVMTFVVGVVTLICGYAVSEARGVDKKLQEHKEAQNEIIMELKVSVAKNTVYLENLIDKMDEISNAINGK